MAKILPLRSGEKRVLDEVLDTKWLQDARKILALDEGSAPRAYWDGNGEIAKPSRPEQGNLTIGIGRNLFANPLDEEEMHFLLDRDIARAVAGARRLVGDSLWEKLDGPRRHAVMSLVFSMGEAKLRTFNETLPAIRREEWQRVAELLRRTKWATDVDPLRRPGIGRDDRIILMFEKGEYDPVYGINN